MATIHDVAQHAGVSPTTVSRYLNKRIELPEATAARIDAAVALHGYRPNLLARRLSTGRTEAIGLVTPEIGNPFFSALAAAIEDEAERHGYSVFMSSTRGDPAREAAALRRLDDRHVDGLILLTNGPDDGTLAEALRGRANVVLLDEDVPGVEVPKVFVENEAGAYLLTRHLIGAGHRAIAHIGGPRDLLSVRERLAGFVRAMDESGLKVLPQHVQLGAYTPEFGSGAMRAILAQPNRPTAVFAASDYLALGVMRTLKSARLAVPRDISLAGFDDMPFAELVDPPLTTVRQPIEAMGRLGFGSLLQLLNHETPPPLTRLPVELVVRHSVAPPRHGMLL